MPNATDMSTPVTRGELRQELEKFATKADLKKFATKDLKKFATKADLEKFATKADLEKFATKVDLEIWVGALAERITESERKLSAELAGHAKALVEWMAGTISGIDDKYRSLPDRVKCLEATVFPGERR
jgi:hypothetical protein